MTGVRIRALQHDDTAAASVLLAQLGYPVDTARLRGRLAKMIERPESRAFVAVTEGGDVVGLATLHLMRLLTDDAPLAWLTSMVVAEGSRGDGIGRAIVEYVAEQAHSHGCGRLCLTTHLRRADAHGFYERLGFEFTGRRYVLDLGTRGVRTITPG